MSRVRIHRPHSLGSQEVRRRFAEVESSLQQLGRSEITSRVVGDMVIERLKDLDHIAYIRYASVYLRMADLHAIRDEIDKLLEA